MKSYRIVILHSAIVRRIIVTEWSNVNYFCDMFSFQSHQHQSKLLALKTSHVVQLQSQVNRVLQKLQTFMKDQFADFITMCGIDAEQQQMQEQEDSLRQSFASHSSTISDMSQLIKDDDSQLNSTQHSQYLLIQRNIQQQDQEIQTDSNRINSMEVTTQTENNHDAEERKQVDKAFVEQQTQVNRIFSLQQLIITNKKLFF